MPDEREPQDRNTSIPLKVKRLDSSVARLPTQAHPGDAGLDLYAVTHQEIPPAETRLIGTGLAIELPPDTEAQIRPRSGLALRHSVTVLNTPGTIDQGYRGEVGVILINHGTEVFVIRPGMKIAQLVVKPTVRVDVIEATALSETTRGPGGFGSTG
ncbi:MAG: dUTP diphosphatase [Acidobacteriota bacterium]|nr:dUTP diphosphatase [Acidobacteriota bacterium]